MEKLNWVADYIGDHGDGFWIVRDLDSDNLDTVAHVDPDDIRWDLDDAAESHARLIAAAPDLLAELDSWVTDCYCQQDSIRHPDGCGRCADSRAAIAKAKGKA